MQPYATLASPTVLSQPSLQTCIFKENLQSIILSAECDYGIYSRIMAIEAFPPEIGVPWNDLRAHTNRLRDGIS